MGISWITARRMLYKLRMVMVRRDSLYRLMTLIEVDDSYVGSKRTGNRSRGVPARHQFGLQLSTIRSMLVLLPSKSSKI